MKFKLKIELGNAEMTSFSDVAGALTELANRVRGFRLELGDNGGLRDINGNTVGAWKVTK
jgi:hypothetical protein